MIEKTLQYHTIIAHVVSKRGYRDWGAEMISGWFRSKPTKFFENRAHRHCTERRPSCRSPRYCPYGHSLEQIASRHLLKEGVFGLSTVAEKSHIITNVSSIHCVRQIQYFLYSQDKRINNPE